MRAISQEILGNLIHDMRQEITLLKLLPTPPGDNTLSVETEIMRDL